MRITIEFNSTAEIHLSGSQSIVEQRVVEAAARKLPKEIQKAYDEMNRLKEYADHLENMNRTMQNWMKEDVVNYLTR